MCSGVKIKRKTLNSNVEPHRFLIFFCAEMQRSSGAPGFSLFGKVDTGCRFRAVR